MGININCQREMEVLYSGSHGGYNLSPEALLELFRTSPELFPEKEGDLGTEEKFLKRNRPTLLRDREGRIRELSSSRIRWSRELRSDPRLLEVVKRLGLAACSTRYCRLQIEQIPDGYEYKIHEYDGEEMVYPVLPYKMIVNDLIHYYRTGEKSFQSPLTQQIIDGQIELD